MHSQVNWPDWVKDKPSCKQTILVKNPVCSIYAEGNSIKQVENLLHNRLDEIELFVKSI
jgi:predicted ATP-grasp superfamily ATP-dependent carboligase